VIAFDDDLIRKTIVKFGRPVASGGGSVLQHRAD
jgi:hypothetical protein